MVDTSLAPSRPLVTCPCCHGQKNLLISVPCLHCEQTGTIPAEVDPYERDPNFVRTDVSQANIDDVARSAGAKHRVRYEPLDLAQPAAPPKRKRRVHYDPRGLVNKPKPRKLSKRSRPRTRNARNDALRNPRNA